MRARNFRSFCKALTVLCVSGGILVGLPDRGTGQESVEAYYPAAVWGKPSGSKMNVSAFAFRDVNRDGVYDLGDRPMAGVVFEAHGPRGKKIGQSNISGFANFAMSVMRTEAEIVDPGNYEFHAVPPPGWSLTSGNRVQTTKISILPGAPGDMVSSMPMAPFGFAPELSISGRTGDGTASQLVVRRPDGTERTETAGAGGAFRIPVTAGNWRLVLTDRASGRRMQRDVLVGAVPVQLSASWSSGPVAKAARRKPEVLNFDTLTHSDAILELPSGYGGLNWRNWVVTHSRNYGGEGYINGTMSGEYVLYNSSGHPAMIWSDQPFDFLGGHFAVAWARAEGETLRIRAFRGDQLVAEDELRLSYLGPVYFDAAYRDVTRVEFATRHYWQVVVDDLVVSVPAK